MRYTLLITIATLLLAGGCKKDKDNNGIPKLKQSITPIPPLYTEADTALYIYNAEGQVINITHSYGGGYETFAYTPTNVINTYYGNTGVAAYTFMYYLNSAGLADSMREFISGNWFYTYKYDANGFLTQKEEFEPSGTLYATHTYINDNKNTHTRYTQLAGNPVTTHPITYDLEHQNSLDNANKGMAFLGKVSANVITGNSVTHSYDNEGRIIARYFPSGSAGVVKFEYTYY
jgi:hypothetical protein